MPSGLTGSQAITNITITAPDLPAETFSVMKCIWSPSPVTIALNGEQSISVLVALRFQNNFMRRHLYGFR